MKEEIVIKNQPILSKIYNNINNYTNNVQAYMLIGSNEELLKENAILLSKILICPQKYKEKCNDCNICKRIDTNTYGELQIIEPVNKVIKKETILEIRENFSTSSIEGKNKIYIINNVECLNQASANSLLKFLEEPEGNVVAIFTTTNKDAVIQTILSRCQLLKMNDINDKFGIDFVTKTTMLEEEKVFLVVDFVKKIEKDFSYAVANIRKIMLSNFEDRESLGKALDVMLLYYKDVLNYKTRNKCLYFETNEIKPIADILDNEVIVAKISFIAQNKAKLDYNINMLLFLNNLIIGIEEQNEKGCRN